MKRFGAAGALSLGRLWAFGVVAAGGLWVLAGLDLGRIHFIGVFLQGLMPPGRLVLVNHLRSVGALVLVTMLILLCDTLGLRLFRWCLGREPRGAIRTAAACGGYVLLSSALLGLSATGLWYAVVLLGGTLAAILMGSREMLNSAGNVAAFARLSWLKSPAWSRLALGLLTAAWFPLMVIPETCIDCMGHSLALPQQMLEAHKLIGTDLYISWALPFPGDLPHVYAVALGLDAAARLTGTILALLGAFSLLSATGARLPGVVSLLVATVALLVPVGRMTLTIGKCDTIALAYVLAAAGIVADSASGRWTLKRAEAALVGLLLGAAVAVKWVVGAPCLGVVTAALWGSSRKAFHRNAVLLAASAAIPLFPWLSKSWFFCADPLYPVGSVVLPGIFGNPDTNRSTRRIFTDYVSRGVSVGEYTSAVAALLLRNSLVAIAAVPFFGRRDRWFGRFMLGTIAGLAIMFSGKRVNLGHINVERYMYCAFALMSVVAMGALFRVTTGARGKERYRAGFGALMAVAIFLLIVPLHLQLVEPSRWHDGERPARVAAYMAGRTSTDEFRRAGLGSYGAVLPAVRRHLAGTAGGGDLLAVGECLFWDIPSRVRVSTVFEPSWVWRAVSQSGSAKRLAVKFRQADLRWVLYDSELTYWARLQDSPYEWTPRMLRLYAGYIRRHFAVRGNAPCEGPGYGSAWFFEILSEPRENEGLVLFIPGAEYAYRRATKAWQNGQYEEAVRLFSDLRVVLPEVVVVRNMLGHVLLSAGRHREALPHIRAAVEAGLSGCIESSVLNHALAASRSGERSEAERALTRAARIHRCWPEAVSRVRELAGLDR